MNAPLAKTFADLSRPIAQSLSYDERERLATAWRGSLRQLEDTIDWIKRYRAIIAKDAYPRDVARARENLPRKVREYRETLRRVVEFEQRMTAAGIRFAQSSYAWGA